MASVYLSPQREVVRKSALMDFQVYGFWLCFYLGILIVEQKITLIILKMMLYMILFLCCRIQMSISWLSSDWDQPRCMEHGYCPKVKSWGDTCFHGKYVSPNQRKS